MKRMNGERERNEFCPEYYFTKSTGYVIEGKRLGGRGSAKKFLLNVYDMEDWEAESFLDRLLKAYFVGKEI